MSEKGDQDVKIVKSTTSRNVFLLTGSYTIDESTNAPVVRFFGRTDDGVAAEIIDGDFSPYFYARDNFTGLSSILSLNPSVTKVEKVKLWVNPVEEADFLKIFTRHPFDVTPLKKILKKLSVGVYAADILYHLRYMYDKDIGPFVKVTGTMMKDDAIERWSITNIERAEPFEPKLSILSIDIENSMLREDRKILCIGMDFSDIEGNRFQSALVGQEEDILRDFIRVIRELDPDVITGYNINQYDLPHIKRRLASYGLGLYIGRDGTEPRPRYRKRADDDEFDDSDVEKWDMNGRIVIDAWKVARVVWHPKRETLAYVASSHGLGTKMDVDTSKIDDEWAKNEHKVVEYCKMDATLAMMIILKTEILFDALYISSTALLPLSHGLLPRQSTLIDSHFIRRFDRRRWAVPCMLYSETKVEKIEGAYVVLPDAGLYEWVLLLDFKSMYPSIMRQNNLCYSTYVHPQHRKGLSLNTTPTGATFLNNLKGVMPTLLEEWQRQRDEAKMKYKETGLEKWNRIQNSLKILMNSAYGLFTSSFYRFTNRDIGESITAFAREEIKALMSKIEPGQKVLYGDTDSVFVSGPKDRDACISLGNAMAKKYSRGNMNIEFAAVFDRWFTHGKKKKYFGHVIWPREEFYVRGYETRRGDSFDYQDEVLGRLLNNIIDINIEPRKACAIASSDVRAILKGKVQTDKLIITKSVRDEKDYVHPERMMGVRAARKLVSYGYRWIPGTKLSWVVTDSTKTPMDIEPWIPERAVKPTPDLTYYAERVVRTIINVTKVFGYDKDGLYSSTAPTRLESFLPGKEA